jgi:hypothetical protein
LDAEEAGSVVEDEVVAAAVSPGLGDAESELGSFVKEGGFGAFAGDLGVLASGGLALAIGFVGGHLGSFAV